MNQARLAPLLARRVAPAASLVRPTLLSVPCRFAGLGRTNSGTTWAKLLKDTADHGPELLVLAMYFVLTCRYILIIFHKIFLSFLTRRLSGTEILNNANFIFKKWLVSWLKQTSFSIWIFLSNMNDNFSNFFSKIRYHIFWLLLLVTIRLKSKYEIFENCNWESKKNYENCHLCSSSFVRQWKMFAKYQ